MICQKCRAELKKYAKICQRCRKNNEKVSSIVQNSISETNPKPQMLSTPQKFKFTDKSSSKVTEVSSDGVSLHVRQYKDLVIKFGEKTDTFDIADIQNITIEQKRAVSSILIAIMCLFIAGVNLSNGHILYGFLALLATFLFARADKYLVIFHKRGIVRIRNSHGGSNDLDAMLNHIRSRNPECIKVVI